VVAAFSSSAATSAPLAPQVHVADHDEVAAGAGDGDVPEVELAVDPADRAVVHAFTGDEGEDHDVAFTALEGVHGADAYTRPAVLPELRAEFVGLGRERGDHADRGLLGEFLQQGPYEAVHLADLVVVHPGAAVRGPGGPSGNVGPEDRLPGQGRAAPCVGEDGQPFRLPKPERLMCKALA
jgi:hypothetical protein